MALCRLLVSQPDVLLLDEPTNHLDASSVSRESRRKKDKDKEEEEEEEDKER